MQRHGTKIAAVRGWLPIVDSGIKYISDVKREGERERARDRDEDGGQQKLGGLKR